MSDIKHDCSSYRLDVGGQINRSKKLYFKFNGKDYFGYEGDTLASALLANGVKVISRSFKYHRPRSIFGLSSEEPNAILQIGEGATTLPNQRATQVKLYDGLIAKSINGYPNINFDLYAGLGIFAKLLSAGFYYKTFMWPKYAWAKYEEKIRKSAGLGISPLENDPDRYEHKNIHTDILIIGGGVAGLTAAVTALRSGKRIIIVDEQDRFGGSLLFSNKRIDGDKPSKWIEKQIKILKNSENIIVLPKTTAFGQYDHNFIAMLQINADDSENLQGRIRQTIWHVRSKKIIFATGAIERGIPFGNNDRPGIMLATAVSGYINHYAVKLANVGVVFTNNDSAYQTAIDMYSSGMEVAAIIDVRKNGAGSIVKKIKELNIPIYNGCAVINTFGRKGIYKIRIKTLSKNSKILCGKKTEIHCDLLAVSGGFSPTIHLHSHIGGENRWDNEKLCFIPDKINNDTYYIGSLTATWGIKDIIEMSQKVAFEAANMKGCPFINIPNILEYSENLISAYWQTPYKKGAARSPKQFLDYQNDTCVSDINQAIDENFQSIEHIKRYTALGFGTDQGKTGNINGMGVASEKLGKNISEVGTTTFRPSYTPVTFGALAGRNIGKNFEPVRTTAIHQWHIENGAEFEAVGQWLRAWYFPKDNETIDDAVARECLAVRNSVGMLDASTLGKIEIKGKDAARFLNMIYTNPFLNLPIGKARYGLMLGEDGMVIDDGVTMRLGEDHFYMHTTTGGAANILSWMERWSQTEWTDMEVFFTSVTDHWATTAVVGPNSRKVMQNICDDIDFSNEKFEFMSFKEGHIDKIPVRICRISFSGELAYEVNVNANYGRYIWEMIYKAGQEFNITPYGTETMHVLRAEKGYIIVGQDTDGSVNPYDLGMGWCIGKNKEFIGDRSLKRSDSLRDGRKQLVGLITSDSNKVIPEGSQLLNEREFIIPADMQGHISSSYYSYNLSKSIALALVKDGLSRIGDDIYSPQSDGSIIQAKIVSPIFYDESGDKRDG